MLTKSQNAKEILRDCLPKEINPTSGTNIKRCYDMIFIMMKLSI